MTCPSGRFPCALSTLGAMALCLVLGLLPVRASWAEGGAELETATFSMYCYWTGEATLGRVEGVEASRIGHWSGSEIVQVDYDPAKTDVQALVAALKRQRSFYSVIGTDGAATSAISPEEIQKAVGRPRFIEPKHSLRTRHPEISKLDLNEAQQIALNSWSYFGGPMPDVLSEEQRSQLDAR